MSNVVTSQPRQEAKINSKELPTSDKNCERCHEDDDQCCFVYFYSLYCSQCRCSGCCNEEKQKRQIPERRGENYFYTSEQRPQRHRVNNYDRSDYDIMFDDDTDITRGFLYDKNGLIHTYSDHRQSDVPVYGEATDTLMSPSEGRAHLGDNIGNRDHFGSGHHHVVHSEGEGHRVASVCHSGSEGLSEEQFKLGGRSRDNNGDGGRSGGECPSPSGEGYSWGHSESRGYLGGHSVGGNDPDMNCWNRDDSACKSEGNNAGGDTNGDCARGDTGGDYGGGDTGGDNGGGDTGGDCGGGDTGGDCGGGDCGGGGDD
ncbi:uncharacterized protein [Maniola hyperantus]|uniref:uncharacterized protein isoform X2 n=1 Tax=Aphantopus hyperantus TaxID=2795564 RepID=UPI003749E700